MKDGFEWEVRILATLCREEMHSWSSGVQFVSSCAQKCTSDGASTLWRRAKCRQPKINYLLIRSCSTYSKHTIYYYCQENVKDVKEKAVCRCGISRAAPQIALLDRICAEDKSPRSNSDTAIHTRAVVRSCQAALLLRWTNAVALAVECCSSIPRLLSLAAELLCEIL